MNLLWYSSFDKLTKAAMALKCKPDSKGNPVVPGMKISLMPHQLTAVKWMVDRENEPAMGRKIPERMAGRANYGKVNSRFTVGGGLLADEMGLGKTIQSIAMMVHNRPTKEDHVKVSF
jgi:SNF2 family DNA or RNA helicase